MIKFRLLFLVFLLFGALYKIDAAVEGRGVKRRAGDAGLEYPDVSKRKRIARDYAVTYHEQVLFPFLSNKRRVAHCLFCKDGGKGMGALGFNLNAERLYVELLYVLPEYRSAGVGSELIKNVLAVARKYNVPVKLDALPFELGQDEFGSSADLEKLIAWYKALGFQLREPEKFDQHFGEGVVPMVFRV